MRCKICAIPHKNTAKYDLWKESQLCRICGHILDFFSWNGNNLGEYWSSFDCSGNWSEKKRSI